MTNRLRRRVYFAERLSDGAIKIGLSANPERRVQMLPPKEGHRLLAVHSIVGWQAEDVEREFHRTFAPSRVHITAPDKWYAPWTEYFWPTDELLALIASLTPEPAA